MKRIYLNTKRSTYTNKSVNAEEDLVKFREEMEKIMSENPKIPTVAEVGMELYDSLLTAATRDVEPKQEKIYLGELFGIKIKIDPSLKPNEVKFKYDS